MSGLYLVRPTWFEPVLEVATGAAHGAMARTEPCASPIGFDEAIARAGSLVSGAPWKALYPADTPQRWELTFATNGNDAFHRETHVVADLECGTVTVEATPDDRSTREAAEMWIAGVHDGTAFGGLGAILVSVAGLSPLLLMWSGLRMWLRRRSAGAARPRHVEPAQTTSNAA